MIWRMTCAGKKQILTMAGIPWTVEKTERYWKGLNCYGPADALEETGVREAKVQYRYKHSRS